jgi:hypothetical protein
LFGQCPIRVIFKKWEVKSNYEESKKGQNHEFRGFKGDFVPLFYIQFPLSKSGEGDKGR